MRTEITYTNPTTVKLVVEADEAELQRIKIQVLTRLSKSGVKLQGFRSGKAPLGLVEKQLDPSVLQSDFLEAAINDLYIKAIEQENIRPVTTPEVNIKKFVPYTTLEFESDIEAVGKMKLPDYKKIKLAKPKITVTAEDVTAVLADLRVRAADKKDVTRAAKAGDQVIIDFNGVDAVSHEPIQGADGKAYPLVIGSNTFIPGFEPHLVGLKPGESKSFDLTFPEDYNVATLKNRAVTFSVSVSQVQQVIEPKLDDAFAAKVDPFNSITELKADIKRQLTAEKEQQSNAEYQNQLLQKIAEKAVVAVPKSLVDEEIERQEKQERQNLVYRGQTWEEHLSEEGQTEEGHREKNRPAAEQNVKAGLILSEIATAEDITVTNDEFDMRIQLLKSQYQDKAMQAEVDKPENRRDIMSRILTEKTIAKLITYATS